MKEKLAGGLISRFKSGQVVGVGAGTTVAAVLKGVAERVRGENLDVAFVPTSFETIWLCQTYGLKVLSPLYCGRVDWGFDGADEVDDRLRLIKGKGGAMLTEKILAVKCAQYVIVVEESKLVKKLGENFPVPVEVVPSALEFVRGAVSRLGATNIALREGRGKDGPTWMDGAKLMVSGKHGPVITEAGNVILDCKFSEISDGLEKSLKQIVGVVESGIFQNYTTELLVARENRIVSKKIADGKVIESPA